VSYLRSSPQAILKSQHINSFNYSNDAALHGCWEPFGTSLPSFSLTILQSQLNKHLCLVLTYDFKIYLFQKPSRYSWWFHLIFVEKQCSLLQSQRGQDISSSSQGQFVWEFSGLSICTLLLVLIFYRKICQVFQKRRLVFHLSKETWDSSKHLYH
jgi:hypothetical protein